MHLGSELLCFAVYVSYIFGCSSAETELQMPQILLNGTEDILEANSDYSAFCQGHKPLIWKTPEVEDRDYKLWTTFRTEPEVPTNPQFRYGLRLYITNMTYKFVGFYYCHYEREESERDEMYLYVDDKHHLSLLPDTDVVQIYARQHDIAVIPCRPTSPTVKVSLTEGDETPVPMDTPDGQYSYHFNPFYGFITNATSKESRDLRVCHFERDGWSEAILLNIIIESRIITHMMENTIHVIEDASFDQKIGFSFVATDIEKEIYICNFSRDTEEVVLYFHLVVEPGISTTYIHVPRITDINRGHTLIGRTINLTCEIDSHVSVDFTWDLPSGQWNKNRIRNTSSENDAQTKKYSNLAILNVTNADEGVYTCHVFDHQNHNNSFSMYVKIYDDDEYEIILHEPNDSTYIQTYAGKDSITWSVYVWGHPEPNYKWVTNQNIEILPDRTDYNDVSRKYSFQLDKNSNISTFIIRNITISDFGIYKLVANNDYENKTLEFFLNVTDKPYVTMGIDKPFHSPGEQGKVYCTATGYPQPIIQWEIKPCVKEDCAYEEISGTPTGSTGLTTSSETIISSSHIVSTVKCTATNFNGSDEDTLEFVVSEFDDGFDITDFDDTVVLDENEGIATYSVGDTIKMTCGASKYIYMKLAWFLDDKELRNNDNDKITIIHSSTDFSNKTYLEIQNASPSDEGTYECRVVSSGESKSKQITIIVRDAVEPSISNPESEEIETDFPKDVKMSCEVYGIPKPKVTWYKNGIIFEPSEPRIIKAVDNRILHFNTTKEDDAAEYECKAENKKGMLSKHWSLRFKNSQRIPPWLYAIIIILSAICIVAVVMVIIKVQKERKLQRVLKEIGLANFEKGAIENINPDLGIDEQAELLPYDKACEFPIERLKLGKQLGSGAFGIVMKGEAKYIIEGEPITVVAVKMVKKNADRTHIKALASELKIMVHLGKHLNVVNLLGACTKNVIKEELLVIVEYCRYGNLLNYLLRHRGQFVNQVDPHTKKVDYSIGQEILDRTYSVSSDRSNTHSPSLKYAALMFSNSSGCSSPPVANNMGDYRANATTDGTMRTEMTTVPQGDDGVILSNNSNQPEWRSNYGGDYKENGRPISTKDLIAWSFQVACGMDYLASRKVLHGDLAARNILLADNNIVKICDFGLAKSMYKSDIYIKRGNCPLPIKWMAIESLRDHVFSVQSDVWSFGIVLWEFFSLGRTPYSGIEAEKLHSKLLDGYRMESPEYAPLDMYNIMTRCWAENPLARPSFSELSDRIGSILEESMRKYYIDLNDPYLAMNTKRLEEGRSDYLAMLSPPTFEALSSPLCVDEGYMSMKPNAIFSPRVTDGHNMFDFNINNRKHSTSDEASGHELLPMLHLPSESDCETPLQSPNSVSNPTYHLPPTIIEENSTQDAEIVKSSDNYVDMLQNKSMMKEKSAVEPVKPEPAYVNSYSRDWDSVGV